VPPRRPIQHQLEDESRRAFDAIVPSRHVFRSEYRDYGIDGEVEEFNEANEATGRRFRVQLKGTGADGADAMRERIRLDTAAYYRAQQEPVLMVRYVASSGRLYGRWFHEFDPHYQHVGETHLTFHWSEADELGEGRIDELFADVERIVRLKTVGSHLPLTVTFEAPQGGVHGSARRELDHALEAAVARCRGVLRYPEDGEQADVTISIGEHEVRASVSGLTSATLHLENDVYTSETSPEEILNDALSCVAVALARAGHGAPAARIAVQFFTDAFLSAIPPLSGELAAAMVQAGRVLEALDIADRLDQHDQEPFRVSGALFMEAVRQSRESLQPHERNELVETLRARLDRRIEAGRRADAAAAAENVGWALMGFQRPGEAVEYLEQAIELDPNRDDEENARGLAGAYFLSGRVEDAVAAYDRAIDLAEQPDPLLDARRADALMHAGRYRQALDAFRSIDTDDVEVSAWAYVKGRALSWVLEATGIEEQDRNPEAATKLAGDRTHQDAVDEEADDIAARVWKHDAVSALGWFNRARDLLNRGLEEDAMQAYLTAAVMSEGDVEAWVNVAILSGNVGDIDLFVASAVTGNRLNEERYMGEFVRQLRKTVPDVEARKEMLAAVRGTIREAVDSPLWGQGG
jgi:tetratricopeptide (TPR) repeat protein